MVKLSGGSITYFAGINKCFFVLYNMYKSHGDNGETHSFFFEKLISVIVTFHIGVMSPVF